MNFIICGKEYAADYVPNVPTLAIRIFGSETAGKGKTLYPPLKPGYKRVLEYSFDDIDLQEGQTLEQWAKGAGLDPKTLVQFDERMARQILTDFARCYGDAEAVLIHCYAGASRSPAVGMALDSIYRLEADFNCREFPLMNVYVYKTMFLTADKMGLL